MNKVVGATKHNDDDATHEVERPKTEAEIKKELQEEFDNQLKAREQAFDEEKRQMKQEMAKMELKLQTLNSKFHAMVILFLYDLKILKIHSNKVNNFTQFFRE